MFPHFKRLLATTTLGLALIANAPTSAQAQSPLTAEQTKAVQELIEKTLIENPEIIANAMAALKAKQVADMEKAQKAAILANQEILHQSDGFTMGAADPKYYMVEFFDYNCGYCRAAFPDVQHIAQSEKDTQIVIKELPVLGPEIQDVSRLAIASREQGKYVEYHTAMMTSRGRLNETSALNIAKDLGLDTEKLKKDAKSDKVATVIMRNHAIANALGIRGTPAFIIGDTLFPGKVDADTLSGALAEQRKKK